MISVVNKDFFTMRRYTVSKVDTTGATKYTTLVNLYTDPKNAELHRYEKKAFLSFVFTSNYDPKDLREEEIYNIMQKSEINQYSMYTDKEYDDLNRLFPPEIRYPSMIFEATEKYNAKNLCLIALPIKGIVPTIKKSNMYRLYNGSLIVCKLFKHQETETSEYEYYNKIIYILADVVTEFTFSEFITTSDPKYGIVNTYSYSLVFNKALENLNIEMIERRASSLVPYLDRRSEFFEPKEPNIFRLSDVPSGIYIKHNSIMKELKTDNVEEREL